MPMEYAAVSEKRQANKGQDVTVWFGEGFCDSGALLRFKYANLRADFTVSGLKIRNLNGRIRHAR
jgi:hypothetical protein